MDVKKQTKFDQLYQEGAATEEALELFDELEAISIKEMIGKWRGSGFSTLHPMDGLLETFNWYGKEFIDENNVHPLLFLDLKNNLFIVDPKKMPMGRAFKLPFLKNKSLRFLFLSLKSVLSTTKTRARIRMMEYRGKVSATMIYDDLPVLDVFRKVDKNTLLGVMDSKGLEQPFFFVLKRE